MHSSSPIRTAPLTATAASPAPPAASSDAALKRTYLRATRLVRPADASPSPAFGFGGLGGVGQPPLLQPSVGRSNARAAERALRQKQAERARERARVAAEREQAAAAQFASMRLYPPSAAPLYAASHAAPYAPFSPLQPASASHSRYSSPFPPSHARHTSFSYTQPIAAWNSGGESAGQQSAFAGQAPTRPATSPAGTLWDMATEMNAVTAAAGLGEQAPSTRERRAAAANGLSSPRSRRAAAALPALPPNSSDDSTPPSPQRAEDEEKEASEWPAAGSNSSNAKLHERPRAKPFNPALEWIVRRSSAPFPHQSASQRAGDKDATATSARNGSATSRRPASGRTEPPAAAPASPGSSRQTYVLRRGGSALANALADLRFPSAGSTLATGHEASLAAAASISSVSALRNGGRPPTLAHGFSVMRALSTASTSSIGSAHVKDSSTVSRFGLSSATHSRAVRPQPLPPATIFDDPRIDWDAESSDGGDDEPARGEQSNVPRGFGPAPEEDLMDLWFFLADPALGLFRPKPQQQQQDALEQRQAANESSTPIVDTPPRGAVAGSARAAARWVNANSAAAFDATVGVSNFVPSASSESPAADSIFSSASSSPAVDNAIPVSVSLPSLVALREAGGGSVRGALAYLHLLAPRVTPSAPGVRADPFDSVEELVAAVQTMRERDAAAGRDPPPLPPNAFKHYARRSLADASVDVADAEAEAARARAAERRAAASRPPPPSLPFDPSPARWLAPQSPESARESERQVRHVAAKLLGFQPPKPAPPSDVPTVSSLLRQPKAAVMNARKWPPNVLALIHAFLQPRDATCMLQCCHAWRQAALSATNL